MTVPGDWFAGRKYNVKASPVLDVVKHRQTGNYTVINTAAASITLTSFTWSLEAPTAGVRGWKSLTDVAAGNARDPPPSWPQTTLLHYF